MPTKEELERENAALRQQVQERTPDEKDAEIQALREQLERSQSAASGPTEEATSYRVLSTSLDGRWNAGEFVTREDLRDYDFDRLLRVGAIRKATEEEREAQAILAEKQIAAIETGQQTGRTPAEILADVEAQRTTGNPLPVNVNVTE